MSLIKKTFVLTDKTPKGYITLVRVGNESGVKIVGENFIRGMNAFVKIDKKSQKLLISGKRTESELNIPLEDTDNISCVVYSGENIVAKGGKELTEREIKEILYKKPAIRTEEKTNNSNIGQPKSVKKEPVLSNIKENPTENGETLHAQKNSNGAEQKPDAVFEQPHERESNVVFEQSHERESDVVIEQPHERESDVVTEQPHERESDVVTEQPHERESDVVTEQPHEREGANEEESISAKKLNEEERNMFERLGEEKRGYYIGISDRIDELFVVYPAEKKLGELIPDSEWVKVNYDGEDYYVVGRLRDGGKVRYLGYGVPGVERIKPPKVADGIANWFPVKGLESGDGYWLFFQDAETGKIG